MKVLLVEDNALTRNTVTALLTKLGHEVVAEAENGEKAVKYFTEFKPDIVFLDIIMPGKSGIDVLQDLRNLDPLVRVVVITAMDQDDVDRRLYDKGVHAILRKPFCLEDFKVLMDELGATTGGPSRRFRDMAAASMEMCMTKLSSLSTGTWNMTGIRMSRGSMDEALRGQALACASGFAVHFNVPCKHPFAAMIIFNPEDIETISRCFLGFSFLELPAATRSQELLFSELANIILNSGINALSNKLKSDHLPSVPKYAQGGTPLLLEALCATLDASQRYSVAAMTINLNCGKDAARSEVLIAIPEILDQALAAA